MTNVQTIPVDIANENGFEFAGTHVIAIASRSIPSDLTVGYVQAGGNTLLAVRIGEIGQREHGYTHFGVHGVFPVTENGAAGAVRGEFIPAPGMNATDLELQHFRFHPLMRQPEDYLPDLYFAGHFSNWDVQGVRSQTSYAGQVLEFDGSFGPFALQLVHEIAPDASYSDFALSITLRAADAGTWIDVVEPITLEWNELIRYRMLGLASGDTGSSDRVTKSFHIALSELIDENDPSGSSRIYAGARYVVRGRMFGATEAQQLQIAEGELDTPESPIHAHMGRTIARCAPEHYAEQDGPLGELLDLSSLPVPQSFTDGTRRFPTNNPGSAATGNRPPMGGTPFRASRFVPLSNLEALRRGAQLEALRPHNDRDQNGDWIDLRTLPGSEVFNSGIWDDATCAALGYVDEHGKPQPQAKASVTRRERGEWSTMDNAHMCGSPFDCWILQRDPVAAWVIEDLAARQIVALDRMAQGRDAYRTCLFWLRYASEFAHEGSRFTIDEAEAMVSRWFQTWVTKAKSNAILNGRYERPWMSQSNGYGTMVSTNEAWAPFMEGIGFDTLLRAQAQCPEIVPAELLDLADACSLWVVRNHGYIDDAGQQQATYAVGIVNIDGKASVSDGTAQRTSSTRGQMLQTASAAVYLLRRDMQIGTEEDRTKALRHLDYVATGNPMGLDYVYSQFLGGIDIEAEFGIAMPAPMLKQPTAIDPGDPNGPTLSEADRGVIATAVDNLGMIRTMRVESSTLTKVIEARNALELELQNDTKTN